MFAKAFVSSINVSTFLLHYF